MPNVVDRLAGASSSLAFKAPCRLATTVNITLSGFQTIDGTLPTVSEHVDLRRILVKNQTLTKDNGIYIMADTAWARAKDFDGAIDFRQGTRFYVYGGSTQSGVYIVTSSMNPSTFVFGTDSITIAAVGTFDQTTSALGLSSGGVISWNSGDVTITHAVNTLAFAGASSGYSFDALITGSSDVVVAGTLAVSSGTSSVVVAGSTVKVPFADVTNARVQANATDATAGFSGSRFSNDSSPARLSLLKSRGTSVGSHTVVQSGDVIGEIRASASDGTIFSQAAMLTFEVDGTPGSSDMPGRVLVKTSSDGSASPSERARVDSTGFTVAGSVSISSALTSSGLITGVAGAAIQSTFTSSGNIHAVSGTTITLGGVAGKGILLFGSTTFGIYAGSSAPAIAAGRGSIYLRDDGGSSLTRAYIQSSGSTNTWVGLLTTA